MEKRTTSMKKSFWISFIVLCLVSTLFHFLYDWTKFAPFKLIAPINESIWEHTKILVIPFLIYSALVAAIKKPKDMLSYLANVARASLAMQGAMFAIYYTYSGMLGKNYLVLDIATAFIGIFIGLVIFASGIRKSTQIKATDASDCKSQKSESNIENAEDENQQKKAYELRNSKKKQKAKNIFWIAMLAAQIICLIVFTYFPPNIPLFISND